VCEACNYHGAIKYRNSDLERGRPDRLDANQEIDSFTVKMVPSSADALKSQILKTVQGIMTND
jgi:hypothetical protein